MFAQRRFLISWLSSALLAVVTQMFMWRQLGSEWPRWFRHEPVLSMYSLVLFPIVFAVIATTLLELLPRASSFVTEVGWNRGARRYLGLGALAVALSAIGLGVIIDLDRRPFPPFLLSDRGMVEEEGRLRNLILQNDQPALTDALERYRRPGAPNGAEAASGTAQTAANTFDSKPVVGAFFTAYVPLSGLGDLYRRGSAAAVSVTILNFVNVTIVLGFFLILGFVATCVDDEYVQQQYFRRLLVPATLAMTWFPIRLYAEWYIGFYSLSFLTEYTALFMLSLLAAGGLTYLTYLSNPGLTLGTYTAVATVATFCASVAAWLRPDTLAHARDIMDNFSLVHYVMVFMILTVWAVSWCHIGSKVHVKRADSAGPREKTPLAGV